MLSVGTTSNRSRPIRSFARRQAGFLTMAVAIGILMLSTLVVFNVSSSILFEQRVVNNDQRARQAFEAAEAGLDSAIAYIREDRDRNDDGVVDPVFDTNGDGMGDSDSRSVGTAAVTVTVEDISDEGDMTTLRITSRGVSDDGTATRTLTYTLVTIYPLPNPPENPLTSRGGVNVSGAARVFNYEGFSTIWSGNDVDLGSNNVTSTYVPETAHAGYPACMDFSMTCNVVGSSHRLVLGVDVIENDSSLAGLSPAELFLNFFGLTPEGYRASVATIDTTAATVAADIQTATHEVVWIEGDVPIQSLTVGCERPLTGTAGCPADEIKPSIVIINGDVSFSGSPTFHGLVFVMGDVNLSGNTRIYGGMAMSGTVSGTGSLDIHYSSEILDGTRFAGGATGSAGSWRDF